MKTHTALYRVIALGALVALVAGPLYAQDTTAVEAQDTTTMQQPAPPSSSAQTVVEVIQQEPDLSMLAQALQQAGMVNALSQGGPYTIFAPSNEAFEQLPEDLRQLIRSDAPSAQDTTRGQQVAAADTAGGATGSQEGRQALIALLRHHVVADNVASAAVADLNQAVTILGDTLNISAEGDQVMIGEATVERPDLEASNGVIHIVDQVLVPAGGVEELVRLNQQQEQQSQQGQDAQQQGAQQQNRVEADTTTLQQEPLEEPMEMEDAPEADTSGVNNR
ncbi:MAG: fasciclin domain-containing protein [Rhodothermales bacterium]